MIDRIRNDDWLQRFFDEELEGVYCGNIHCTTCGGSSLWKALEPAIAAQLGRPFRRISRAEVEAVVLAGLRRLEPGPRSGSKFEPAVTALLYRYTSWHEPGALRGTWVEEFLRYRSSIDAAHRARRVEHERFNSPEAVLARRTEARAARQEQHLKRQQLHRERGRRWLEEHPDRLT